MLCFQETNRVDDGACHKTAAHTGNLETRGAGTARAKRRESENSLSLSLSLLRGAREELYVTLRTITIDSRTMRALSG